MDLYFLKADSEEALFAVLAEAGLVDSKTDQPLEPERVSINVLGTLFERTGLTLIDGATERHAYFRPLPGYYATVTGRLSSAQKSMLPIVSPPDEVIRFLF